MDLVKNNAVLINTSRGGVIDEDYLIRSLAKKRIAFAGLDVYKNEPEIDKRLMRLDNVILTNHIAGKTEESAVRTSKEIFEKINNYFK